MKLNKMHLLKCPQKLHCQVSRTIMTRKFHIDYPIIYIESQTLDTYTHNELPKHEYLLPKNFKYIPLFPSLT